MLFCVAPLASEKVPRGHRAHTVPPSREAHVPVSHSRHPVDARPFEYCPAGHALHVDAMDSENDPAVQFRHADAAAV